VKVARRQASGLAYEFCLPAIPGSRHVVRLFKTTCSPSLKSAGTPHNQGSQTTIRRPSGVLRNPSVHSIHSHTIAHRRSGVRACRRCTACSHSVLQTSILSSSFGLFGFRGDRLAEDCGTFLFRPSLSTRYLHIRASFAVSPAFRVLPFGC